MSKLTKVESYPDLRRCSETGALININTSKIRSARERLKRLQTKDEEIEQLKDELGEMKKLLYQLLEKNSNGENTSS